MTDEWADSEGFKIAASIVADGERLEREKEGLALLPHEAMTIKAATFLRQIMPTPKSVADCDN